MGSKSIFDEIGYIKVSSQLFICSSEDGNAMYLIDPKTLGVLDSYNAVADDEKIDHLFDILH